MIHPSIPPVRHPELSPLARARRAIIRERARQIRRDMGKPPMEALR